MIGMDSMNSCLRACNDYFLSFVNPKIFSQESLSSRRQRANNTFSQLGSTNNTGANWRRLHRHYPPSPRGVAPIESFSVLGSFNSSHHLAHSHLHSHTHSHNSSSIQSTHDREHSRIVSIIFWGRHLPTHIVPRRSSLIFNSRKCISWTRHNLSVFGQFIFPVFFPGRYLPSSPDKGNVAGGCQSFS